MKIWFLRFVMYSLLVWCCSASSQIGNLQNSHNNPSIQKTKSVFCIAQKDEMKELLQKELGDQSDQVDMISWENSAEQKNIAQFILRDQNQRIFQKTITLEPDTCAIQAQKMALKLETSTYALKPTMKKYLETNTAPPLTQEPATKTVNAIQPIMKVDSVKEEQRKSVEAMKPLDVSPSIESSIKKIEKPVELNDSKVTVKRPLLWSIEPEMGLAAGFFSETALNIAVHGGVGTALFRLPMFVQISTKMLWWFPRRHALEPGIYDVPDGYIDSQRIELLVGARLYAAFGTCEKNQWLCFYAASSMFVGNTWVQATNIANPIVANNNLHYRTELQIGWQTPLGMTVNVFSGLSLPTLDVAVVPVGTLYTTSLIDVGLNVGYRFGQLWP